MKKRYFISALALVLALSVAMPAMGAPSPTKLLKQALGLSKKADKRSKKALKLAQKKNAAGALGAQGPAGANGGSGPQGPQGLQGLPGVQNVTPLADGDPRCSKSGGWIVSFSSGDTTLICNGKEGPQGLQGTKGDKGDHGNSCVQEYDLATCKGNNGSNGTNGNNGADGAKGDKGDHGYSCVQEFDLATCKGDKGNNGANGLQGLKGDKGDHGDQGLQGQTGGQGSQGVQGSKGDKGDQGNLGPQGPKGDKGPQGDASLPGAIDTTQLAPGAVDDTKVKKHSLGTGEIGTTDLNSPVTVTSGSMSLGKGACADLAGTVTGAALGDFVVMNAPALPNGLIATVLGVTGTDSATVRVCNISGQGNSTTVPNTGWSFWLIEQP